MADFHVGIDIDTRNLLLRLNKGEKRLAYAVVNALNETAKRIQAGERQHLLKQFTVRQIAFMQREVAKIERKNFANVKRGQAWVEIGVGQKPRLLLSEFEKGGERLPFVGKNVAIPVLGGPARPTMRSRVPRGLQFQSLAFRDVYGRKSHGRSIVGQRRTYIVPNVGVFQRTGPKRRQTRMLYAFRPRLTLDDRLEFVRTARLVADRWFKEEMEKQVADALAHDQGKRA